MILETIKGEVDHNKHPGASAIHTHDGLPVICTETLLDKFFPGFPSGPKVDVWFVIHDRKAANRVEVTVSEFGARMFDGKILAVYPDGSVIIRELFEKYGTFYVEIHYQEK